jgi:hypothetical protein
MADEQKENSNVDQKAVSAHQKIEFETADEAKISRTVGQKVTDVVPDVLSPEDEDADSSFRHDGDFWSQVKNILATAGFSLGKVIGCFLGIVVLAGVLVFFVSGGFRSVMNSLPSFGTSTDSPSRRDLPFLQQSDEVLQQYQQVQNVSAPSLPESVQSLSNPDTLHVLDLSGLTTNFVIGGYQGLRLVRSENLTPTLHASYVFGQSEKRTPFLSQALQSSRASYALGHQGASSDRFAKYLITLGQIENVLDTDVFELLNRTSRRADALDQYIQDLQSLFAQATSYADMVDREMATYKSQYDEIVAQRDLAENDFFDATSRYQSDATNAALQKFINLSKDAVDLKAHNLALAKLASGYKVALPKLDSRIRDIRLNREPLLRGVKVFDVQGSSLDLILPDKNLE